MTKHTLKLIFANSGKWRGLDIDATATVESLEELYDVLSASEDGDFEVQDLDSLPTFGGDEPADTMGVWSWDEDQLIIGEDGTFQLVDREDCLESEE